MSLVAPRAPRRVVFVDLLRLVASFQMVQGHTLDAVLAEAHRTGPVFDAWTWTRGLTSVAFLFASGVSFYLATLVRPEAHVADPRAVRRRFERGLLLVLLGHLMHVPVWIVDVLQCIGVTLILMEGLTLLMRTRRRVVLAAGGLSAAAIALAPAAASVDPSGPFAPLLHYVSPRGGSIFPLVPWAGYLLAGVVVAAVAVPEGARTPRPQVVRRLLGIGAVLIAAGLAGQALGGGSPPAGVVKLGAVVLGSGLLARAAPGVGRLPRRLEILAGQTLVLYLSHVMVLYGAGVGLAHVIGRTLPLPQAIILAAAMILATAAVGLGWHRIEGLRAGLAGRPQTG